MTKNCVLQIRYCLLLICLGCFSGESYSEEKSELTNSLGMKFVHIKPGTFKMGSPAGEANSFDNERQHDVEISQSFFLGAYEVTQSQFNKVMGSNPSLYQGEKAAKVTPEKRHPVTNRIIQDKVVIQVNTENYPVENVNWEDAVEFCRLLSELPEEVQHGRQYRLPTEAEWEYACRAGTKTTYSCGSSNKTLPNFAWFAANSDEHPHEVGTRKPNSWGLYDMHGNVWEWCQDWYSEYPREKIIDPKGSAEGTEKILRGGSWYVTPENLRSAYRPSRSPTFESFDFGFRIVLEIKNEPKNKK